MGSNWVTSYVNGGDRPSRYEPTPEHWLELQRRLGRWGSRYSRTLAVDFSGQKRLS